MSDSIKITGTVTDVQAAGKYTAKSGKNEGKVMFKFDVHLHCEDGSDPFGQVSTEQTDAPVKIGDRITVNSYKAKDPQYPDSWYLDTGKGTGFKGGQGRAWTPDPERATRKERWAVQLMITRQACLNTAASLISSGGGAADFANITGLAEQLETWVKRGIDLKSIVAHANGNGTPAQATVTNDPPAPYVKLPNAPLAEVADPF